MVLNGVVVWKSEARALIWCEDQGALAYCDLSTEPEAQDVARGDLVLFQDSERDGLRFAQSLAPVERNAAPQLADLLATKSSDATMSLTNNRSLQPQPNDHVGSPNPKNVSEPKSGQSTTIPAGPAFETGTKPSGKHKAGGAQVVDFQKFVRRRLSA
jgi:hypothetical protein